MKKTNANIVGSVYKNRFFFKITTKNRPELKITNNCQFVTANCWQWQFITNLVINGRAPLHCMAFTLVTFR